MIGATAWGVVGCSDVTYPEGATSAGARIKYVHAHDAETLRGHSREKGLKLLLRFTGSSILQYTSDMEAQFQSKTVERTRGVERIPFW